MTIGIAQKQLDYPLNGRKRRKWGAEQMLLPAGYMLVMENYIIKQELTFNADDVVANLLGNLLVRYQFDEVVNGIDRWMNTFEPLDLLSNSQRIVEKLEIVP